MAHFSHPTTPPTRNLYQLARHFEATRAPGSIVPRETPTAARPTTLLRWPDRHLRPRPVIQTTSPERPRPQQVYQVRPSYAPDSSRDRSGAASTRPSPACRRQHHYRRKRRAQLPSRRPSTAPATRRAATPPSQLSVTMRQTRAPTRPEPTQTQRNAHGAARTRLERRRPLPRNRSGSPTRPFPRIRGYTTLEKMIELRAARRFDPCPPKSPRPWHETMYAQRRKSPSPS